MRGKLPILTLTAVAALAAAPASHANAQIVWAGRDALPSSAPVRAVTPQDMLILLDSLDIEARLVALPRNAGGRAHPLGVAANTDGLYWDVVFYGCSGQGAALSAADVEDGESLPEIDLRAVSGCRDFALSAGFDLEFPVSVQTINRFNREHRFARAVLAEDGSPMIEMDVSLDGGVSRDALEAEIAAWRALLLKFSRYIGY